MQESWGDATRKASTTSVLAGPEASSKAYGGDTVTSTYPANHVDCAAPVAKPDRQVQKKMTQARMVVTATAAIRGVDGRRNRGRSCSRWREREPPEPGGGAGSVAALAVG